MSAVVAFGDAGMSSSTSDGVATGPDTAAIISTDIGYDGDAESVTRLMNSKETRKDVTAASSKSNFTTNEDDPVSPIDVMKELADENIGNAPEIPAKAPMFPLMSSNSSDSSAAGTATSSTARSRKSLSAAVQVATMQASFAEKTSSEMQEIVGWYEATASEERFIKVDQRDSLPNNAMVYDLDDEEDEEEESEDNKHSGDNILDDGNRTLGRSSGVDSSFSSPLQSTPKRRPSSQKKTPRSSQIREHLEASDDLIRNTQYMADVIAELEHSSSASSIEQIPIVSSTRPSPARRRRRCSNDKTELDKEESDDSEILHTMSEDSVGSVQSFASQQSLHRRRRSSKDRDSSRDVSILAFVVGPIGLAIVIGVFWKVKHGHHL